MLHQCTKELESNSRKMEQLPVEVERLQNQLMEQKISPDDFFAMLISLFELDKSKGFIRTVIENLKSLTAANPWDARLREIQRDLVEKYEDFFCETFAGKEDTYWSDNEGRFVEDYVGQLDLGSSEEFDDDKSGNPKEAALAFNLSLNEVEAEQKLCSKGNLTNSGENGKRGKKKKKRKKDENSAVLLWFRRDLRVYDNPALVTACSLGKPVRVTTVLDLTRYRIKIPSLISYHASGDPSLFVE